MNLSLAKHAILRTGVDEVALLDDNIQAVVGHRRINADHVEAGLMLVGGDDWLVVVSNQMIDLLLLDWILDYVGHLALDAFPVHVQALLEQLRALLGVLCECRLCEIPASILEGFQLDSAGQCFHVCDLNVGKFEYLRNDVHPVNIFGLIKHFLELFASIERNYFKADLINFQFSLW